MADLEHQPHGAVQGDPLIAGQREDLVRDTGLWVSAPKHPRAEGFTGHISEEEEVGDTPRTPTSHQPASLVQRLPAVLNASPPGPSHPGATESVQMCVDDVGLHSEAKVAFQTMTPPPPPRNSGGPSSTQLRITLSCF